MFILFSNYYSYPESNFKQFLHICSTEMDGWMDAFVSTIVEKKQLTVPSANAEMTFPRDDRDLLMFLASSSTAPSAPVLLTYRPQKIPNSIRKTPEHRPYQQGILPT